VSQNAIFDIAKCYKCVYLSRIGAHGHFNRLLDSSEMCPLKKKKEKPKIEETKEEKRKI
jgi:acetyl-CoA carboxylase beta subunit